ncbi:MAG: NAD(+) diphosphatase [Actinomycetia bacterium]|nr:NAD(+) diphosphatase [Actinomycetes bacterium]
MVSFGPDNERFDPLVHPPAGFEGTAIYIAVRKGHVLVDDETGELPTIDPDVPHTSRHFLGLIDGTAVWGLDVHDDHHPSDDWRFVHLRQLYGGIPEHHWVLAGRAEQIATFERTHQFCGQCGSPTEPHERDRARVCPACGHMAFPRLTPAVIMRITRGDEILLAHGRQFPGRFFSTLAGFVEPGESLEHAVAREVREEVGIEISTPQYFSSQPWPFPHSLMIGFTAEYESGEIAIQEEEIVEAGWFAADAMPPSPKGGMSIAGWMIEEWLERHSAGG